jgi:hypothetical protein
VLTQTRRWVDALFELTALRLFVWFTVAVTTYPGVLLNPYKLANWFDDHALYAFDEADRLTVLQYGQLPSWNPFWCGGASGIAEPEDAFYSPDFLLRLVFGSEHGRRLAILLFLVMGFEGMYRLCRRLDSTAVASVLAAIAFGTCDRFVSFIHDGWVHFLSFGLCSWVLLSLINGVSSLAWRLAGGFFLAWLILAPGTYPAPYTAVAFGYVFVVLVAQGVFKDQPEPFKGPLLSAFTIGGVGLLLCACKLVPTTLYMREFTRQFAPVETHSPQEMFGPFATRYGALVVLALVGAIVGDLGAGICIGGALLFFVLSLGDSGPWSAFHLMKKVPLLSQLRFPDRFTVMVLFFTALAASRGLSRIEDAIPRLVTALGKRASKLSTILERRSFSPSGREVKWLAVAVAAVVSFKIAAPLAEELMAAQRAPSLGLYVEEAPRQLVQEFKQSRGNRRDAHIYVHLNMGSLNCVAGIPIPESARLRSDLPQEEYPADPAVAEVKRVKWSPNAIVLDVNAKDATRIFVNQNWARQWRTNLGTVRNDQGLLAVDVPEGHHTLKLDYRDNVVYLSALVSLATLLTLMWFGGRRVVRGARREWAKFASLPTWPNSTETVTPEAPAKHEESSKES